MTTSCLLSCLLCLGWTVNVSNCFSALSPPRNAKFDAQQDDFNDKVLTNHFEGLPLVNGNSRAPYNHKTAVLLNTNARAVNSDLVPIAESIFGKEYVHVTTSEEEGKLAAAKMVQQNISMVIPVGGDGTLSSMINFLCDAIIAREEESSDTSVMTTDDALKQLPLVGYIPLGTGNGVGSVVGSETLSNNPPWKVFRQKRRLRKQVQNMMKAFHSIGQQLNRDPNFMITQHSPDVIDLPMMQVSYPQQQHEQKDTLCFFAGAGFDSLMLQDFQSIKKWAIRRRFLAKSLSSVAGYCVALVLKTLPRCVTRQEHNIQVKLTTRDPDTLWVDHRRGDVVQTVGPSSGTSTAKEALLYEGTTGILAAGTSPFYGGGLRLFPFARLTKDKMHLRLGRIHPLRGFFNIPKIFEGSFRDKSASSFGCLDYIGGDFDIHVTSTTTDSTTQEQVRGFPVQHSGESVGYFERFRLRVIPTPVRFVTLMEKRIVSEGRTEGGVAP